MPYETIEPASRGHEGERSAWNAIGRGFMNRCPACGQGRLFNRFLKVTPACAVCGEELHHERADDFPPYITISIVAKVVVWGIVLAEQFGDWPMGLHMAIWPALTVVLALVLMQPVKGAVIGYQWARRMHGFGRDEDTEAVLRPRAVEAAR